MNEWLALQATFALMSKITHLVVIHNIVSADRAAYSQSQQAVIRQIEK